MEYVLDNRDFNPYTFVADDFETASLAVFLLGSDFGAASKDDKGVVPMIPREEMMEWYIKEFGRTTQAGFDEKRTSVISALDSVMYGDFEDRKIYEMAMNYIPDAHNRREFSAMWSKQHNHQWWESKEENLTDAAREAHELAKRLKNKTRIMEDVDYERKCNP